METPGQARTWRDKTEITNGLEDDRLFFQITVCGWNRAAEARIDEITPKLNAGGKETKFA
jgi:hypothetical protein